MMVMGLMWCADMDWPPACHHAKGFYQIDGLVRGGDGYEKNAQSNQPRKDAIDNLESDLQSLQLQMAKIPANFGNN